MENEKLMSMLSRFLFSAALVFLAAAVVQKVLYMFGTTGLPWVAVLPREFLYWTVPPLLFVIAILLRQIREESKLS